MVCVNEEPDLATKIDKTDEALDDDAADETYISSTTTVDARILQRHEKMAFNVQCGARESLQLRDQYDRSRVERAHRLQFCRAQAKGPACNPRAWTDGAWETHKIANFEDDYLDLHLVAQDSADEMRRSEAVRLAATRGSTEPADR